MSKASVEEIKLESSGLRGVIAENFADAAQVNDFQAPASTENPLLEEFYYVSPQEPTAHFRHEGKANVVYVDGHVDKLLPVDGSIDSRMPTENVGRLLKSALMINALEN